MLDKILNDNTFYMKNGVFSAWYNGHCYKFETVTDDFGNIAIVSFKLNKGE